MTKVFISYSRKDKAFAEKLNKALKDINLDSWIDWDDIPPTADWWDQIQKGIEAADAFLFLLSPDSVASQVCGQEIEHAIKNGKRLIPLVARDVNASDVHSTLTKLNWIFFREQDDFAVSLKKLEAGIKTDLVWVETHRRLQVRAVEWDKRKDGSLLLRGKDLREAEMQLATAGQKDPLPTDLQRRFLLEGRRAETRNRNIIFRVGVFVLISLIGLLIFSFVQLDISRAQRLGLAAQTAFAEKNYSLAGLYAYQSSQIRENSEATEVLGKLPYENFALGKAMLASTEINEVAWSTDGRLASADWNSNIIIWNSISGEPAKVIHNLGDVNISALAWSKDGQLASTYGDLVFTWDINSGTYDHFLSGHTGEVNSLAWSENGHLASGSDDGTIIIWDLKTEKPAQVLKYSSPIKGIAWSKDGHLASGSTDNTVVVWDLNTGEPGQILKGHTDGVTSVTWSADGKLASSSRDNTIIIWNLESNLPAQILRGHTSAVESVAWSPDGRLASASDDKTVVIWDRSTGTPSRVLTGHSSWVKSVAWSPDGQLASGSSDRSVILWDLDPLLPAQTLKGHTNWISDLAVSTTGQLASSSFDNTVIVWDLETSLPFQILRGHTNGVDSVAWSPDGHLASGSADKTVIIWDLKTSQPAEILLGHTDSVNSVSWSTDGRLASGSRDGTIIIWDLKKGKPAQILKGHTGSVNSVDWSSDGRLASGSSDKTVIVWDLQNGQPAQILKGHTHSVTNLDWSSDNRLASGSNDKTVFIWNLDTGRPAQILKGHKNNISAVDWSDNGTLATASADNSIIIWDLKTGRPVQILVGHEGYKKGEGILQTAWLADGRLASGGIDDLIKITSKKLTSTNPCNWISRNMTGEEWLAYQGVLYTYQPACLNLPSRVVDFSGQSLVSGEVFIYRKYRIILLVVSLFVIILLVSMLWFTRNIARWIWHRLKN